MCGAALVPLSQTVLLNINTREQHGRAMAIWGAGIMVGPILGPTLGGWLTETFDWRWVFYVNLPVGLLALAGMIAFLPRTPQRRRSFDFFGFAMLSLAIGALQLLLDRGEQVGWLDSPEIWIELGIVVSGLWAFVLHITGRRDAFIDPKMFRDRNLLTALGMIFVVGVILLAGLALLPPMLQNVHGLSGGDDRAGPGAARRRHDDLDADRRPADRQGRCAPADPDRALADRVLALADDAASRS